MIRVGKSAGRENKAAAQSAACRTAPGVFASNDRSANILALLGAAICVAFFAVSLARGESVSPQNDPDAAVAVAASADVYFTDSAVSPKADPAAESPTASPEAGQSAAESATAFPKAGQSAAESADTSQKSEPGESPNTSIWARLEALLRRLMRRESVSS